MITGNGEGPMDNSLKDYESTRIGSSDYFRVGASCLLASIEVINKLDDTVYLLVYDEYQKNMNDNFFYILLHVVLNYHF